MHKDLPEPIELCGWGRYPRSRARVLGMSREGDPERALAARGGLHVLGRGAGRAYGDAALNAENLILDLRPSDRFLAFDPKTGVLHAEAGVTLEQVLETFVPRGWFLPVTPGTKYPTLGGSVACDVHGKSAHPIGHYLKRLHLLLADGSRVVCSPRERADLFWATVGGMGLTGLILSVELQLVRIETSWIQYQGDKTRDLEGVFRLFEERDQAPLSVAWIDCLASGRSLGRSTLMRGRFARRRDLTTVAARRDPLHVPHKPKLMVPFATPAWTLNPLTVAAFNAVIYGKHPRRLETLMDHDAFFYPLDSILRWNLVYGSPGLIQYQFLIPRERAFDGIKTVLEAISRTGKASFLAVLKKFGDIRNPAPLSFPMPGYFLALDFPKGNGAILQDMDRWDELVLKFGGRIYLAKDARMRRATFEPMYPRLKEWKRVKTKVDPRGAFTSDLGRRLGLCEIRGHPPNSFG